MTLCKRGLNGLHKVIMNGLVQSPVSGQTSL